MCRVISVSNQKGGIGKSSVVANLGIGLARSGKKVLLIDADPQGSLTASLGYQEPDDIRVTLATIMTCIINEEDFPADYGILHHEEGVDDASIFAALYVLDLYGGVLHALGLYGQLYPA